MCYEVIKTEKTVENREVTVYGIRSVQDGGLFEVNDVSADRNFVEELVEKFNRLGVQKELLLETVEDAVATHYTL